MIQTEKIIKNMQKILKKEYPGIRYPKTKNNIRCASPVLVILPAKTKKIKSGDLK